MIGRTEDVNTEILLMKDGKGAFAKISFVLNFERKVLKITKKRRQCTAQRGITDKGFFSMVNLKVDVRDFCNRQHQI